MNRPDNLQVIATTWLLAGIFEYCRQRNISADLIVKNTTLDATTTNHETALSWQDYTQAIANLHHLLPDQEFDEACGLRWRLPDNIFWKDLALILDDPQDLLVELIGEQGDLFYGLPIRSEIKESRQGLLRIHLTWPSQQNPTSSYLKLLRAEISSFAGLIGLHKVMVSTNQSASGVDLDCRFNSEFSLLHRILYLPIKRLMSTHRLLLSVQALRLKARQHRAEQHLLKSQLLKQAFDNRLVEQQLKRYNSLVMRDCWYISPQGEFLLSAANSMSPLSSSLEACDHNLNHLLKAASQPLFSHFVKQISIRPDQVQSVDLNLNAASRPVLSIKLLYLGTDSEIQAQGVIIDTSEQSVLQQNHDDLISLGRSLSEINPTAMVILDQANHIIWSSDAFQDLTGASPSELRDQNLTSLIPESLADRQLRDFYYSPEPSNQVREIKAKMISKNNSLREIKISGSNLDQRHNGSKLLLIEDQRQQVTALNERRRLQLELDKSRKMAATGNLLSSVVHDLSNFLVAINGYAALAMQEQSPEHKNHASQILHAGQQANALTLKLLNFNKQQPRQTTVQDLRGILKNSASLLNQVTTPDIKLVTRYPKDPLYADVVEDQIENILLNLIINARDALLEGGEIKLVVAPAFLTPEFCKVEPWAKPGRFCEISVQDNGTGIPVEILPHIFEPFFSTKTSDQGSGLGLANIRQLVEANKGFISLTSKPSKGTLVRIFLPRCGAPAKRVAKNTDVIQPKEETLLLIEPDQNVSEYAQLVLRSVGYTVLTANTGDEGLALYQQHHEDIHLLLTELVLPQFPGQKLIDQIQLYNPDQKILICSAHLHFPRHASYISRKQIPVLAKPYLLEDLRRAVATTLISPDKQAISERR